jgi:hypothetical protein
MSVEDQILPKNRRGSRQKHSGLRASLHVLRKRNPGVTSLRAAHVESKTILLGFFLLPLSAFQVEKKFKYQQQR